MTPMEIALLVIGVIIFVLSFLLPNTGEKKSEKQIEKEQEDVRRMMEQELDGMKFRVNEATNDSINYAVDRAERSLEKVSNEKIMAVNEYSQTIIEEINKNHQEVMFLYDMLKDKHTDLTNSVREADATAKRIEKYTKTAKSATRGLESELSAISITKKGLTEEQKSVFDEVDNVQVDRFTSMPEMGMQKAADVSPVVDTLNDSIVNTFGNTQEVQNADINTSVVMDMMSGTVYKSDASNETMTPVFDSSDNNVNFGKVSDGANNNQRILELHNQGMTTVDIAKELKLGVGEVKLVIDLYQ